jgi:hypothetical protein
MAEGEKERGGREEGERGRERGERQGREGKRGRKLTQQDISE